MKNNIDLMLERAFSINSENDAREVLLLIEEIHDALNKYYLGLKDPDNRLLNLLINLRYYVQSWLDENEYSREWSKSLINAIGKTLLKTAEYDLQIKPNKEAVKKRNQEKLAICDELRKQEKLPVEEESGKPYDMTIFMATYDQLELTKICLESVFKHTNDVSYEIFLIDNGSSDGSYEYFKQDPRLKVIRLMKNVGLLLALHIFYESLLDNGKFWMYMNNDVIVTPRWASEMLVCMKSDPKIGMVVPATNRTSPFLSIDVPIDVYDFDKIYDFGNTYNNSNPAQWMDVVMIYPFVGLMRPEIKRNFGYYEDAFYYKFYYADGDFVMSLIKSGYRVIQSRNIYVHHFDGGSNLLNKRRKMLDRGESDFFKKFGFFPTDPDKAIPPVGFDFNNSLPRNLLFLEFSRGNVIGMVKNLHKLAKNTEAKYYSADTMEKFNCESLWEDVPFEKMESWYDIENIFPGVEFDLIIYLGNIATMRYPLKFLKGVREKLTTNGRISFYLETNTGLSALNYTFSSSRSSARDACRLRKNTLMSIDEQLKIVREAGLSVDGIVYNTVIEEYCVFNENIIKKYRMLSNSDINLNKLESNIRLITHAITARKQNNVEKDDMTMEEVLQKYKARA